MWRTCFTAFPVVLLDYALTKGIKTTGLPWQCVCNAVLLDYALTKGIKTSALGISHSPNTVLLDYALTKGIKTTNTRAKAQHTASYWTTP